MFEEYILQFYRKIRKIDEIIRLWIGTWINLIRILTNNIYYIGPSIDEKVSVKLKFSNFKIILLFVIFQLFLIKLNAVSYKYHME